MPYDKATDFIMGNNPAVINAWLKEHEGRISDDEYLLYCHKFYHLHPGSEYPTHRLCAFLNRLRHYEMAYVMARRGLEKFPDDAQIWNFCISLEHLFENVETRLSRARDYLDRFPDIVAPVIHYANLLYAVGRKNEAMDMLKSYGTNKYELDETLCLALSRLYQKELRNEDAINTLEQFFAKKRNLQVALKLIELYLRNKNYEAVFTIFNAIKDNSKLYSDDRIYVYMSELVCGIVESGTDNPDMMAKALRILPMQDMKKFAHGMNMEELCPSDTIPILRNLTMSRIGVKTIKIIIRILNEYKFDRNIELYNILKYPLEDVNINIKYIGISVISYIIHKNRTEGIKKLARMVNNNWGDFLSSDTGAYYALLIARIDRNSSLMTAIVEHVRNNRNMYGEFIGKMIDKYVNREKLIATTDYTFDHLTYEGGGTRYKIAVCVSGQLRGYEEAYASWDSYLRLSEHDTDFYVSVWRNIGTSVPKLGQYSRNLPANLFQVIRQHYKLWDLFTYDYPACKSIVSKKRYVDRDKLREVYGTENIILEDDVKYPFNTFSSLYKMLYKRNSCVNMINKYYDIMILIRPDLKFKCAQDSGIANKIYFDCVENNAIYSEWPLGRAGWTVGVGETYYIGKLRTMMDFAKMYTHVLSGDDTGKYLAYNQRNSFWSHYSAGAFIFQNGIRLGRFKEDFSLVDANIFRPAELMELLKKDACKRGMNEVDRLLIEACQKDMDNEKRA